MTAQFPAAIPIYTNPTASMTLGSADHDVLHSDANDDIVQLATKLGSGATSSVTALGTALVGTAPGISGWFQVVQGATLIVAASNASAASKRLAHYICDGVSDNVEINAAAVALPAGGGRVLLTEGTFSITAPITTNKASTVIEGQGPSTIIQVANAAPSTNATLVSLGHANSQAVNFKIDGNKANNAGQTSMFLVGALSGANCQIRGIWGINSAGFGIFTSVVSGVIVRDCFVDASASQNYLIRSSGTPAIVACCVSNAGGGFTFDSGAVVLTHCIAINSAGAGFGSSGTDITFNGCLAVSNGANGFLISGTRNTLSGCYARSNTGSGVGSTASGTFLSVIGCTAVLNVGTAGIDLTTADCVVEACHVIQNGQHGIRTTGARTVIQGNRIIDNGTAIAATYNGIAVAADDCFIDGNMVRKGAAVANKLAYGVQIIGSNNYLGMNDLFDSGVTGEIQDLGTNTRRVRRLQLDYVASTDLMSSTAIPANTWTAVSANQTFRVDSATSVIEIMVAGSMLAGASGSANTDHSTRIVIDSAGTPINKKIGGDRTEGAGGFCNPIGQAAVKVTGLAIGNHTVRLEVRSTVASTGFLRASTIPEQEHLNIQVTEDQR